MSFVAPPPRRFMDTIESGLLRELGLPTLIVSLVLFVSAMMLLGANVSELRRGYARVQHSNEALLALETVENDILRVEMTLRGYILSGDPIYLTWKEMGEAQMNDQLSTVDTLIANDPVQRGNLKQLKQMLAEHCSYFEKLAKRVPTERDKVVAEIVSYSRHAGRHGIENLIVAMRASETRQLAIDQLAAENRVVSAYRYAIGMSLAALILAAIGFSLLLHDRRAARRNSRNAIA